MPLTREEILHSVSVDKSTNAGLWLDKFLRDTGDEAKKTLVKDIARTIVPPYFYKQFYDRWKDVLEKSGAVCREARTLGRLAINLGAESVLETSIALHHTYGVPYLPGSALKGLSAHYAASHLNTDQWGKKSIAYQTLFGDTTSAGYVNFFDALYVPDSGHKGQPLWSDIITVHHPDYYQVGNKPPADWDNPTPIPFLTATGRYLIALSGPGDWVSAAYTILELALQQEGIGAKTSSGYGRMEFVNHRLFKTASATQPAVVQQQVLPPGYQRGIVKNFFDTYGFIQPDAGGKDVFVHIADLAAGVNILKPKQRVVYKPGPGKKPGQIQASDVRLDE